MFRFQIMPYIGQLVGKFQYGSGFNGGETAFPHLYIRLIRDYCLEQGISGSLNFLDIATAFATMLRRVLFDTDEGDEPWFKKLHIAGFSEEDIIAITTVISGYRENHFSAEPPPPFPMLTCIPNIKTRGSLTSFLMVS